MIFRVSIRCVSCSSLKDYGKFLFVPHCTFSQFFCERPIIESLKLCYIRKFSSRFCYGECWFYVSLFSGVVVYSSSIDFQFWYLISSFRFHSRLEFVNYCMGSAWDVIAWNLFLHASSLLRIARTLWWYSLVNLFFITVTRYRCFLCS